MKEIHLTKGKVAKVDDADFEWLNQWKWHLRIGYKTDYASRQEKSLDKRTRQKTIRLHRLILNAPDDVQVDHVDGDGLNNQRSNLRLCTAKENAFNRRKRIDGIDNSMYKGVHMYMTNKGLPRWQAYGRTPDERIKHLGTFYSELSAAQAYDDWARKYYGEFARFNFPGKILQDLPSHGIEEQDRAA